jgi:hypothetical protein
MQLSKTVDRRRAWAIQAPYPSQAICRAALLMASTKSSRSARPRVLLRRADGVGDAFPLDLSLLALACDVAICAHVVTAGIAPFISIAAHFYTQRARADRFRVAGHEPLRCQSPTAFAS